LKTAQYQKIIDSRDKKQQNSQADYLLQGFGRMAEKQADSQPGVPLTILPN
jgi:hypothetical protein